MVVVSSSGKHEPDGISMFKSHIDGPQSVRCQVPAAPIWMVARATTATPRYFEPILIEGRTYMDGLPISTNPSEFAREEAAGPRNPPALFLSLGSGRRPRLAKRLTELTNLMLNQLQSVSRPGSVDGAANFGLGGVGVYNHRLNVDKGDLHTIPRHEWYLAAEGQTREQEIRLATAEYLRETEVQQKIDTIAKEAVRIRRARAETERWEALAVDVFYICPQCFNGHRYGARSDLRDHLETDCLEHPHLTPEEVDVVLDQGRIYEGRPPGKVDREDAASRSPQA